MLLYKVLLSWVEWAVACRWLHACDSKIAELRQWKRSSVELLMELDCGGFRILSLTDQSSALLPSLDTQSQQRQDTIPRASATPDQGWGMEIRAVN